MAKPSLIVTVAADISNLSRNLDAAEKRLLRAGDQLEKVGQNLSLKVTAPLLALSAAFAKSAAEDAASVEKLGRTFGAAQGQMEQFTQSLMKSVPATDDSIRDLLSSTGALLTSMGAAPAKSAAMSQSVLKLAGDLAAYNHVSLETATDAVNKALAGRTRGLTALNVVVTDADVKAKAYQLGLAKVGSELSSTAKAQATLAAITERMGVQQGEAARTYGDSENALARLKQSADGVADSFGAVVLPAFVKATDAAGGMLKSLAALPDTTKSVIVGVGAAVAALGPLIYVGGTLVKTYSLASAALGSLVATSALSGMGAMLASVTSLSEAVTALGIAGSAVVTAFAPLAIGVMAVGGIGYLFFKAGEEARAARAEVDSFRVALGNLATVAEAQAKAREVAAKLAQIPKAPVRGYSNSVSAGLAYALPQFAGVFQSDDAFATQRKMLQDELIAANARTRQLGALGVTTPPGGGGGGGGGGSGAGTDPLTALTRQASTLARTYELTNAQGQPLLGLNAAITDTMQRLSAALAAQTNQWGELALKIRQAKLELSGAARAGDATLIAHATATGAPGVSTAMSNITGANLPTLREPPSLTKQVTLQERMVAQLATLPGQFASSLGQYLGPVIAQLGGGKGGAIGAALGGGIGGAIGTALVPQGMGKIAGAVLGSTIPVVGTIIGSLAGSFIGGTIGKLFGGGGPSPAEKAAEQLNALARAAQKVQEAISGLPEGVKIASYRFDAEDAAPVNTKPGGGTGKTGGDTTGDTGNAKGGGTTTAPGGSAPGSGMSLPGGKDGGSSKSYTFTGDIHLNGVTDLSSLFRQLSDYADSQTGRGGVTGLQLAAG